MDHFFDKRAPVPADDFWFIRPRARTQGVDIQAPELSRKELLQVFSRDWTDTSVRFGAVRWYAL